MRQPNEITHNGKTLAEWLEINKTQDAADICVPYNTDGKARCGRLMLVRKVTA